MSKDFTPRSETIDSAEFRRRFASVSVGRRPIAVKCREEFFCRSVEFYSFHLKSFFANERFRIDKSSGIETGFGEFVAIPEFKTKKN